MCYVQQLLIAHAVAANMFENQDTYPGTWTQSCEEDLQKELGAQSLLRQDLGVSWAWLLGVH